MLAPEPPSDLRLFAFVPYLCSVLYFVVLSLSKQYYIFRPLSKSVGKGIGTVLVL